MRKVTRQQEYNLSGSSWSKSGSRKIGLFCLAVVALAIAAYVYCYTGGRSFESPPPKPMLYLFALMFGVGGLSSLHYAYVTTTRPKLPLVYRPWRRGIKAIKPILLLSGLLAVIAYIMLDAELEGKKAKELEQILLFFVVIFGLILIWKILLFLRAGVQGMRFGSTSIQLSSSQPLRRGESFTARFQNAKLGAKREIVKVTFSNLREEWGGRNSNNIPVTTVYSEQEQTVVLQSDATPIKLQIPEDGYATNYHENSPTYWELEIRGESSDFYSRFFVEVIDS